MIFGALLGIGILSFGVYFVVQYLLTKKFEAVLEKQKQNANLAVAAESKKVAVIVDNLQQALFAVGSGGVIVEPITQFSQNIFGRDITGDFLMQTLYKSLNSRKEVYDSIEGAIFTVMGENELQWDLVESNFPRKVEYVILNEDTGIEVQKLLKINISPIWNSEENLDRLLFVVEDITNFEKLELQFKHEQEQTGMVECVLENSLEDLNIAIEQFKQALHECRLLTKNIDPSNFMELQRILHTMKGSARQLKMRVLSDQIHNSESAIMAQMSKIIHSDNTDTITDELNKIDHVIQAHRGIIQKFLRSESTWGEGMIPIYPLAIMQAEAAVIATKDVVPRATYDSLVNALARLEFKSVAALAAKFVPMVADISKELSKKVEIEIESDALVSAEQALALQECLLHLIRNSIDHGIEAPADRLAHNKSEIGKIKIFCQDSVDAVTVTISDNGRGIDSAVVAASAVAKGLVTDAQLANFSTQDKINLIFLPNFSTKTVANNISGRGIGMDVVKDTIESIGGSIVIQAEKGNGMVITIRLHHTPTEKNLSVAA